MKKSVDDFIRDHSHINYCEAIIYPDGFVEYAEPSHVEALLKITNEDRDIIYKKMPIWDAPIIWLTEYTGCIPVWTNGYIKPKLCSKEQEISLKKLIENKLVSNNNII